MNKEIKIIKSTNSFCLPKLGKKKPNNRAIYDGSGTIDKSTETNKISKCDISTVVDFTDNKSEPLNRKQNQLNDFPACTDIKEIVFNNDKFQDESILKTDLPYSEKISRTYFLSSELSSDSSLRKLSMTLKDILGQNDYSDKPKSSNLFPSPHLSKEFLNFPSYQIEKESHEKDGLAYRNDIFDGKRKLCNDSSKAKTFDYYETTTLLPIGQGVNSITTQKPNSRFSPAESSSPNPSYKHISKSNFQQFPQANDANNPDNQEINPTIEIPPHMPPLLSVNRNGYSSFSSSKINSRRKVFSENYFHKRNIFHGNNNINKDDDNNDIDSLSFHTENGSDQRSPKTPSSYTYTDFQKPKFYEKDLSSTNSSFSYLPTKLSTSYSSLSNSKGINHGYYKCLNTAKNLQNHISTAF